MAETPIENGRNGNDSGQGDHRQHAEIGQSSDRIAQFHGNSPPLLLGLERVANDEEIQGVAEHLQTVKHAVSPLLESAGKLWSGRVPMVCEGNREYFRDVYDHLVRLYDIAEGLRDLAAGALDTYLSVINNRMNEVMKTFTLITTLFMPITFVTGFFGMNFFTASNPPAAWTGRIAFIGICAAMVLVPGLLYLWLKKRRKV